MTLPRYAIPTAEAFDPMDQYAIGDIVGQTVATDVWGGSQPIGNIIPYSATGRGPLGQGIIYRKDLPSIDQWAAAQMVIPLEFTDSAVGVRVSANGSGYFVSNMTSMEVSISTNPFLRYLTPDIGSPPETPTWQEGGIYYWDHPVGPTWLNGGYHFSATSLNRRNPDGSFTALGGFTTNTSITVGGVTAPLAYLLGNWDGTFWMVEAYGQDPVTIRVGVLYQREGAGSLSLPDKAFGHCELFTVVDWSAGRLRTGAPGMFGPSAGSGSYHGFNAGTAYSLQARAGAVSGNAVTLSGTRRPGTSITVVKG